MLPVMARRKTPPPEPELLVARIESFAQSYYIAQDRARDPSVEDEALIDITAIIEDISKRHKKLIGEKIEITLACSRVVEDSGPAVARDHAFLLTMNLRKGYRGCMVYMPRDPFWAIPRMIETGRVTHIEARFEPIRYGDGELLSLHFCHGHPERIDLRRPSDE